MDDVANASGSQVSCLFFFFLHDDGDGSREDVKDENVVSSDFCHTCEVIFGYFLQAKLSSLSKPAPFFPRGSLFGKKPEWKKPFCFKIFIQ